MRLRPAVPQTSPKSSRSPGLPFCKNRPLSTRSESTLMQLLISLHFNSRRCNTYKKTGGGCLLPAAKFYNSLLATRRQTRRARVAATSFPSSASAYFPSHRGCALQAPTLPTQILPSFLTAAECVTRRNCRNSIRFMPLLHIFWTPGAGCPAFSCPFLCPPLSFRYNLHSPGSRRTHDR